MEINVTQNNEEIIVIPSIYKDMEKPPKFIFRSPNSQDLLYFIWGGSKNVYEATCNCFLRFENKLNIKVNGQQFDYYNYKNFVECGTSTDIALINYECMTAVYNRLNEMQDEAKKTEKKSQSPTNSTKKVQGDKEITLKDTATKGQ